MKLGKVLIASLMTGLFMFTPVVSNTCALVSYAAEDTAPTFSKYWVQDDKGNWKVQRPDGSIVKNAWLCDDAVKTNGQDVWYLLDKDGVMISAGLVQDNTGKYYSLETNHNGYFGMLRYKTGEYDGIQMLLNEKHEGAFASIMNKKALEALTEKYGVTKVSIDNSNCVYTSKFKDAK